MEKTEVQVILIEADLLNEIQIKNTPQILTTEALTELTKKLIVTSVMTPDIGPIIRLNTVEDQPINTRESTGEQEEKTTDSDDPKNNAEIENVVKNLLRAQMMTKIRIWKMRKIKSSPNTIKMMR